jgi:arylsulfatase A-like enzyme
VAAATVAAAVALGASPGQAQVVEDPRPNVVVIMTDDQHVGSERFMPAVQELLTAQGTTFENAMATTSLCCPSRASFLTGQHAHNHGVRRNASPGGGYPALDQSETLPVWLQRAGYATAHVGKFLNGYGKADATEVPLGWTEWYGSIDNSTYRMYGYRLNENGTVVRYGEGPADYQTDVYADKAVDVIERRAASPEPFFLSVATLAPHLELDRAPPRPAPRHAGAFADEPLPRSPSFDEGNVSDKPAVIQGLSPLGPAAIDKITTRYRSRLESLLAVDDLVRDVVSALEQSGELDETLLVFTSDNGYFHGEHRIRFDKRYPHEESIRVPLILRGPGIPAAATRTALAANVDLAPTILDATGASTGEEHVVDGASLLPLAADPGAGAGRPVLLQYWVDGASPVPAYSAARTPDHLYVEYDGGDRELYDLAADPYQLDSRHADPAYQPVRERLAAQLDWLRGCVGRLCRSRAPELSLELDFERERTDQGRVCADSRVIARVLGDDPDGVARAAVFRVRGSVVAEDPDAPFEASIRRGRLRRDRRTPIAATVRFGYGRTEAFEDSAPRRCP